MTRKEFYQAVAEQAEISTDEAKRILDLARDTICGQIQQGNIVDLGGFGTFTTCDVPARHVINRATRKPMYLRASKKPDFQPGKILKEAVKKSNSL